MKKIILISISFCISLLNVVFAQIKLDSGLAAKYYFNGNANDESGNGNNGVVHGAILTTDRFGNENSAFYFDGENDYIDLGIPDLLKFKEGETFTISTWIFRESPLESPSIVSFGDNAYHLYLQIAPHYFVQWAKHLVANTGNTETTTSTVEHMWYHIVAINCVGQYVKIIMNGIERFNVSFNQTYSYTNNLHIGYTNEQFKFFFYGKIDDVRFYNRALDANEINTLYNEESNGSIPTDLIKAEPSFIVADHIQSEFDVIVTCNDEWEASPDASWVKVNPAQGIGSDTLKIIIDSSNNTLENRKASVIVKGKSTCVVDICQKPGATIVLQDTVIYLSGFNNSSEFLRWNTNISEVQITSNSGWLSCIDSIKDEYCYKAIIAIENPYTIPREAIITFSGVGAQNKYIRVIQEGKNYFWKSYTISNSGLVDQKINTIAVDSNNNKWIGTDNGLSLFDGSNWITYNTTNGMANNHVNCITIGNQNRVWVGTESGVSCFDGMKWTSYLNDNNIHSICGENNGTIWAVANEGELFSFDGTSWSQNSFINPVNSTFADKGGNVWITDGNNLLKKDNSTWDTIKTLDLNGVIIKAFVENDSIIWVIYSEKYPNSTSYGVKRIVNEQVKEVYLGFFNECSGPWAECYTPPINEILADNLNSIWIMSNGWAKKFYNGFGVAFSEANGLIDNNVNCIAIDKGNNKWFGTDEGISVLVENEEFLTAIFQSRISTGIVLYPNPTNNQIQFTLPIILINHGQLEFFDFIGRQILTQTLPIMQQGETVTIDLSNQPAGIYLVRLKTGNEEFSGKVLLVK